MHDRSRIAIVFILTFNLSAAMAFAQPDKWKIDIAGGAAPTAGAISSRLTTGWNVDVGAEREIDNGVGLRGDFGYYGLGVSDQVLKTLQVPSGAARMLSLTVGPTWGFPISSRVNGYVLGGVGWYRRTIEFTQPTVAVVDVVDPWWGYIGSELVPANQVLGSVTSNALGANVGGRVSVPLGESGSELFVEVRYHYANTKTTSTTVVPVSFGIRLSGRTLGSP